MKVIKTSSGKKEVCLPDNKIKLLIIGTCFAAVSIYIAPPWELNYDSARSNSYQFVIAWSVLSFFAWHMLFTRTRVNINLDVGVIEYKLFSLFPLAKRQFPIDKVQAICVEKLPAEKHVSYGVFIYFDGQQQSLHLISGAKSKVEPIASAIAKACHKPLSIAD